MCSIRSRISVSESSLCGMNCDGGDGGRSQTRWLSSGRHLMSGHRRISNSSDHLILPRTNSSAGFGPCGHSHGRKWKIDVLRVGSRRGGYTLSGVESVRNVALRPRDGAGQCIGGETPSENALIRGLKVSPTVATWLPRKPSPHGNQRKQTERDRDRNCREGLQVGAASRVFFSFFRVQSVPPTRIIHGSASASRSHARRVSPGIVPFSFGPRLPGRQVPSGGPAQ